jgi:hypothetical protein
MDYTSPHRQDFEKDLKFYMKKFRDQVPQPSWNKFTKKQQQNILEAQKGNRGSTGTIVAKFLISKERPQPQETLAIPVLHRRHFPD